MCKIMPRVLLVIICICVCALAHTDLALAEQGDYLLELPDDLEPGSKIVCTVKSLNLRQTPTTAEDNIIAVLKKGDILLFLGFEGESWVHVQTNEGVIGYCSTLYVRYAPIPTVMPSPISIITTKPSPTPEQTIEQTPKLAPAASGIYIDSWASKSVFEKMACLPVWLYFVIGAGVIFVVLHRLITAKRK